MRLKPVQSKYLRNLVGDCITYGLTPDQELEYIRIEMKRMGFEKTEFESRVVRKIKQELESDTTTQKWYDRFARIGFVKLHKKLIDDLQRQYDDTLKQLFVEEVKSPRSEGMIIRLKTIMIEQGNQLEELALGNPTIALLKQKLDKTQIVQ